MKLRAYLADADYPIDDRRTNDEKVTLGDLLDVDPDDPGCDAGFELIAQHVDLELDDEDAAARFHGLAAHLRSCPGCRIDHDGILEAARGEH